MKEMKQNEINQNECRCEKASCGCAPAAAERCTCGAACGCVRACRCGDGCACAAATQA